MSKDQMINQLIDILMSNAKMLQAKDEVISDLIEENQRLRSLFGRAWEEAAFLEYHADFRRVDA